MRVTGIICEYNPLHLGHLHQMQEVRSQIGEDGGIVCLMSGNYVQRGMPAIIDKSLRAKAAIGCGADLVLEMPVQYALSSAEGFAAGGVAILSPFCHNLCFGAETNGASLLLGTARALLSDAFPAALRQYLDQGLSFPAARVKALEAMGFSSICLTNPNDILAVEYCKAILSQGSAMEPMPIHRPGSYHDPVADADNPSATAVRFAMEKGEEWKAYVPESAQGCFEGVRLHTLAAGERAVLMKLRTMTDAEFEQLPFGSEGLWRKLMHAAREKNTLEEIITAVKSKRYTYTRISRMILCAYLSITDEMLRSPAPYARVLALNDKGRAILKEARKNGLFYNAGESVDHPYWDLELRAGDLYGLFAVGAPEAPGAEKRRRVFYSEK